MSEQTQIPLKQLFFTLLIASVILTTASVLSAWTGPTATPPGGNVPAPINVGTTDQVKDASLGLNGLAVFGNAMLSGTGLYLNFGSTAGSSGYGFRDSGGTMQFKNSGGSWASFSQGVSGSSINELNDVDTSSATDGQVLTYSSTSADWEAADASGGNSCPNGFASVNNQYCIQTNENAATTWWSANDSCYAVGASLCSWGEWYAACNNTAGLNGMIDNREWVDNATNNSGSAKVVGDGSCTSESDSNNLSYSRAFRCCYTK
jgi:hypothetical protein